MIGYIILLISITISSFSQIVLKKGATKGYQGFIRQYLNIYVISGYGMLFISLFLTTMSMKYLQYKIVPLIESLGYVIVVFLSGIFFSEKITAKKIIGTCIILIGIAVYHI